MAEPTNNAPDGQLWHGDVLDVLAQLPAESVHCAVTSPPYWGLRRYANDQGIEPYGLEPTIEQYIQKTLTVLRALRKVLRNDGICWVNLGDSYAGSGSPGGDYRQGDRGDDYLRPYNRQGNGLKPLDMGLIPERVALAAQADGWWVRSVVERSGLE